MGPRGREARTILPFLVLVGCGGGQEPSDGLNQSLIPLTSATPAPQLSVDDRPSVQFIPISALPDERFRYFATASNPNATEVAVLAPGVYAEVGATRSTDPAHYTSVFGLCSDVNVYSEKYFVSNSCW